MGQLKLSGRGGSLRQSLLSSRACTGVNLGKFLINILNSKLGLRVHDKHSNSTGGALR